MRLELVDEIDGWCKCQRWICLVDEARTYLYSRSPTCSPSWHGLRATGRAAHQTDPSSPFCACARRVCGTREAQANANRELDFQIRAWLVWSLLTLSLARPRGRPQTGDGNVSAGRALQWSPESRAEQGRRGDQGMSRAGEVSWQTWLGRVGGPQRREGGRLSGQSVGARGTAGRRAVEARRRGQASGAAADPGRPTRSSGQRAEGRTVVLRGAGLLGETRGASGRGRRAARPGRPGRSAGGRCRPGRAKACACCPRRWRERPSSALAGSARGRLVLLSNLHVFSALRSETIYK